MEQVLAKPEKIRFRSDEITDLAALPSACGLELNAERPGPGRRAARIALGCVAGLVSLVLLAIAIAFAIGPSGIGAERLRAGAEKAIEQVAGADMTAALGPTRLTLDRSWSPAIEVRDVSFKNAADGSDMVEAGLVRFGIRLLPLLSGDLQVSSLTLGEARIVAAGLPRNGADWAASMRNDAGLIDPGRLAEAVFRAADGMLDAVQAQSTRRIALQDIEIVLSGQGEAKLLRIAEATLADAGTGGLDLAAEADLDGRAITIAAAARRDPASGRIAALEATASSPAQAAADPTKPGLRLGSVELRISGAEGIGPQASRLTANLVVKGSEIGLGRRGVLAGDVEATALLASSDSQVHLRRLRVASGRTVLDFDGAVTSQPAEAGKPAYRYRLLSRRSSFAPEDSPERALHAQLRVEGRFDADTGMLHADSMILKSGEPGEVLGTASVEFAEGKAPGLFAAFSVHDMEVSQVKQLWPWFSAPPARLWVLSKLFGGRVSDGRLQFKVEPGRLGNGVPLTGDEVFGTIALRDTRFDTAGLIPPVRDAVGSVDFRGNDVDITLASGTVYMASGRSVMASNGTLEIRKANLRPVIGKLDIDVAGEAPAVAEFASYDPINAMRYTAFAPDDLTGKVAGNVKADIPLHKGIDTSTLGWLVALDYEDLSIAKPVEGRSITEANGSITVMPGKAVISTEAKLSGVPAEIDLVQPLGRSDVERERKIVLMLDEKGRDVFAPGLSEFVDGTVKVTLDALGDGRQKVSADLAAAKLDIPWAGWTKGPGIAGTADFILESAEGRSNLSDFRLSGKSFGIDGAVTLADGGLESARFSRVSLNRGDDVAISVRKSGANYSVAIEGNSLDARSVVKQFTSDSETATKGSGGGAVSVSADVRSLTGFHGERLSNLKLDYKGSGGAVNTLTVSAATASGAAVNIRNSAEGGGRTMQMQSGDAGAILRFLDIYKNMEGGAIRLSLAGARDAPMTGQVDARDFWVVNEPRLGSIVSTTPPGDRRSLNQAVKRDLDTSRVKFERGFAEITKGKGSLALNRGVLRGPLIGVTFQGTLYDRAGNMDMTGTFMPAYGLNRLFGELPLIGIILGNGRDRGLIGVTFKLTGDANAPNLLINPLSVIAPGIFRSIFEFQ